MFWENSFPKIFHYKLRYLCVLIFRLNMSQSFTQSSTKSTPRKRRRGDTSVQQSSSDFVQETSSSSDSRSSYASSGMVLGSMEICEVSEQGKYVKVKNMADEVKYCFIIKASATIYLLIFADKRLLFKSEGRVSHRWLLWMLEYNM